MDSGIYRIRNKINDKSYIGQGVIISNRRQSHFGSLKRGKHKNNHLQNAYNKYGKSNFEWIPLFECSIESLDYLETFYIRIFHANDPKYGYNMDSGGNSKGKRMTEETKKKMSLARIGIKLSDETKRRLSEALKGKKFSEQHKQNISKEKIGEKNPFYGKEHSSETKEKISKIGKGRKISEQHRLNIIKSKMGEKNPFYGKKHSLETKEKISKAGIGRTFSKETLERRSELMKGENNPMFGKKHTAEWVKKMLETKAKNKSIKELKLIEDIKDILE